MSRTQRWTIRAYCLPLAGIDAALDNAARAIAEARGNGDKGIHVRHESVGNVPFFVPGTDGVLIHPKVAPRDGEHVIAKNYPNSFLKTDLKETLDSEGIEEVTVIGVMSHMCIDATTRAAADFGYRTTCRTRRLRNPRTRIRGEGSACRTGPHGGDVGTCVRVCDGHLGRRLSGQVTQAAAGACSPAVRVFAQRIARPARLYSG